VVVSSIISSSCLIVSESVVIAGAFIEKAMKVEERRVQLEGKKFFRFLSIRNSPSIIITCAINIYPKV